MRRVVLSDTACNFNAFISNQSIFNCLITGESTLNKQCIVVLKYLKCKHNFSKRGSQCIQVLVREVVI